MGMYAPLGRERRLSDLILMVYDTDITVHSHQGNQSRYKQNNDKGIQAMEDNARQVMTQGIQPP
jgi:hypothetical protein